MTWIGIGNTLWRRGGGASFDWDAYWASLISATVENDAPNNVVLTFPTAQSSLGASDFTIDGFTINSASWAGSVLILVLNEEVMLYDGNLTITFVTTGETATVENNVNTDSYAIAIYDSQDLTTITKDGSNYVSLWKDKLGSGRDLYQTTGSSQPLWSADGITFDGIDDWMRAQPFTYSQPLQLYTVINPITWKSGSVFFSDASQDHFSNRMNNIIQLAMYSGVYVGYLPFTPDNLIIWRSFANGANSKIQINNNTPIISNGGTRGLQHGIHLGSQNSIAEPPTVTSFANVLFKEIILRNVTATESQEKRIYNYLANKYGFETI